MAENKVDVQNLVLEYASRQAKMKKAQADFDSFKEQFYGTVRDFMERTGKKSFSFRAGESVMFVSDVRPTKVTFDAEAIRRKVPEDLTELFVNDEYVSNDWKSFMEYMRKVGADEAMVLSFFDRKSKVDTETLDWLVESNVVAMEQLEGTYAVNVGNGYVKVTEVDGGCAEG